jgi:hypothetical protein
MEEFEIKQSEPKEVNKFDGIISELGRREVVVLMNRPTRWGYTVDAVIPSAKVVLLKMPDMSNHFKEARSMFQDLMTRLQDDGYKVMVVPKTNMSGEQIKAFCDRISV